jgi:hypothetical protein
MVKPTTNSIANWFGINRMLASSVATQLGTPEWVGVPCMGGAPELQFIKARTCMAADLHRHLINLARVIRDEELNTDLMRRLDATLFHEDELRQAQDRCRVREASLPGGVFDGSGLFASDQPSQTTEAPDVAWAYDYFLCTWMAPGGRSGTRGEFRQSMSVRWDAGGGDSCGRFRSAAESLQAWSKILRPWTFLTLDIFDFLSKAKDQPGHALYIDTPWPDDGDDYKHAFTYATHRRLAALLSRYREARIVVRFGDHPLIHEIYADWTWIRQASRDQANESVDEVLLVNGPAYGGGGQ